MRLTVTTTLKGKQVENWLKNMSQLMTQEEKRGLIEEGFLRVKDKSGITTDYQLTEEN